MHIISHQKCGYLELAILITTFLHTFARSLNFAILPLPIYSKDF